MSNSRFTTHQLATAGVIAALYAVLAYFASMFVGCLVANLLSPYGALDIIFGSLATLLAAVWTQHTHHKWLAPLPPVLCNAVIVGAVISFQETGFTGAFAGAFAYNAVTVGVGEAIACYVLGGVLLTVLPKVPALRRQMPSCS